MPETEEGAAFFRPLSMNDHAPGPRVMGLEPGLLTHGFAIGADGGATTIPEVTVEGTPPVGDVPYYETPIWRLLGVAGMAIGAYHGYKRNNSVGWAIGWGLLGGLIPIIVIPIAFAQGIGKPKGRS
jgi:hypothetical protein